MALPQITPRQTRLLLLGAVAAGFIGVVRRRRRMDFRGKKVLISGASRGLGLELARTFAAEGAKIALVARDREQLQEIANELPGSIVVPCDIRNYEEVRKSIAAVLDHYGAIDVLVNNAGIIQVGPVEHMKLDDFAQAMAVHFWGPLYLMQEVTPQMKRRGCGRIVNIASIGGKVAVPHLLPYVASKFALVGLSEGLRMELAKDGILVTTVCPGMMRTGSHLNALFKGSHEKEYALFSIANGFPLLSADSTRAARQIVAACRLGRPEIMITPQARLLHLANSLFPAAIAESMSLIARALPRSRDAGGDLLKRGWESRSRLSSSLLTRLADRAAFRNKQRPLPSSSP